MALYIAYNCALSTLQTISTGQSIATGAKVTLQLQVPDNMCITLKEFGWMSDASTANGSLVEIATTDTGTTLGTAHSTTTIKPIQNNQFNASRLTMATTGTAFGATIPVSNTTLRTLHKGYMPQQYVYQWPMGYEPVVGNGTAENFVQVRANTLATVNVVTWLVWDEE
jgi:hypothetical protein